MAQTVHPDHIAVLRRALSVLDPSYPVAGQDYLTLVDRLRTVLDEELARLTAPPPATQE